MQPALSFLGARISLRGSPNSVSAHSHTTDIHFRLAHFATGFASSQSLLSKGYNISLNVLAVKSRLSTSFRSTRATALRGHIKSGQRKWPGTRLFYSVAS